MHWIKEYTKIHWIKGYISIHWITELIWEECNEIENKNKK